VNYGETFAFLRLAERTWWRRSRVLTDVYEAGRCDEGYRYRYKRAGPPTPVRETRHVHSLVGLAAAVLAILLVGLYIGRDIVLLVATVLSPLALATYALPQTDEIARTWWRVFSALLFVQVVQALLVEVGIELLHHTDWLGGPTSDLVSGLVLVTLLFLLFKLPFAAYHWAFHHPLSHSPVVQSAVTATKVVVTAAKAAAASDGSPKRAGESRA
jgi:hypothetical protein